jgi:hypothetical protein
VKRNSSFSINNNKYCARYQQCHFARETAREQKRFGNLARAFLVNPNRSSGSYSTILVCAIPMLTCDDITRVIAIPVARFNLLSSPMLLLLPTLLLKCISRKTPAIHQRSRTSVITSPQRSCSYIHLLLASRIS